MPGIFASKDRYICSTLLTQCKTECFLYPPLLILLENVSRTGQGYKTGELDCQPEKSTLWRNLEWNLVSTCENVSLSQI